MNNKLNCLFVLFTLITSAFLNAQSYFTKGNQEAILGPFSTINGQWFAVTPSNNTLGSNYYQGLNFGFDINNYVSIVNGVGTNDLYFGRWAYEWKDWNKIWHSGNLNNVNTDFTAKILNVSKINLIIPGNGNTIDGFTVDIQSFGTSENAERSSFFRVRDIGAGNYIPFIIKGNGNIGIGTISPDEKLTVKGKIHSQEVRVDMLGPLVPDYVFKNDYKLNTLEEVEDFINENKHLPEIPSATEIEKKGLMLAEMNMILLKKVEELTLYMIELKKENNKQNKKISALENKIIKK